MIRACPSEAVLRAATVNAAYELHQDDVTGSLEVGKLANMQSYSIAIRLKCQRKRSPRPE